MWRRQGLHVLLTAAVFVAVAALIPDATHRVWIAMSACVLHQAWVVAWWRPELHGKRVTARFGYPLGFRLFQVGFAALAFVRVSTVWWLAMAEPGGAMLPDPWRAVAVGVMAVAFVSIMASVKLTFGMERAFGLDHWEPERCRELGYVARGLHRWVPNAMYVFAPSVLFVAAIGWGSYPALVVCLANWALLWVHYYCTEKPDLETIYGSSVDGA